VQHALLDWIAVDPRAAGASQIVQHVTTVPPAQLRVVAGDARILKDDDVVQRASDGHDGPEEIHVALAVQDQERAAWRHHRLPLGRLFARFHLMRTQSRRCARFLWHPACVYAYVVRRHVPIG
jgi:hypothetical protein